MVPELVEGAWDESGVPEPAEGPLLKGHLPLVANSGSFDKLNHNCLQLPPAALLTPKTSVYISSLRGRRPKQSIFTETNKFFPHKIKKKLTFTDACLDFSHEIFFFQFLWVVFEDKNSDLQVHAQIIPHKNFVFQFLWEVFYIKT